MIKKYLSLVLFVLIVLGMILPAHAQLSEPLSLSASFIKFAAVENGDAILAFPEENTSVYARTRVTNNGETAKAAVFWVGLYKDNVLTDIQYCRRVIPAGVTLTVAAPPITIPVGCNSENTEIKGYVWDSFTAGNAITRVANMLRDNGQLRYIHIDGSLIENFSNEKTNYIYRVPTDSAKRPKIVAQALDNATKIDISDYSIPGQAEVTVTQGDGAAKVFTIEMIYASGKITNLSNKLGSKEYRAFNNLQPKSLTELRNLYLTVGDSWEEYCRCYVDRGFTALSDSANTGRLPSNNAAYTGTGEYLNDYAGSWFNMWIAKGTKSGDTSSFFYDASWIATGNDDKGSTYMTEAHDDAITFTTDRGATVYVATNNSTFTNFQANGWTKDASGYKVYQGDGTGFLNIFTKHFQAGEVTIPSQGVSLSRMYIPIIIWDEADIDDNADLEAVSYKMPGADSYISLNGVSADIDSYVIAVDGTDAANIPKINAVPVDKRSEVSISYPQAVPDTDAVITITSLSGQQRQYTIHFQVENKKKSYGTLTSFVQSMLRKIGIVDM